METKIKLSSIHESSWTKAIRICVWTATLTVFSLMFVKSWKFDVGLGGLFPLMTFLFTLPIFMGTAKELHSKIWHLLLIVCCTALGVLVACSFTEPPIDTQEMGILTFWGILLTGYLLLDQTLLRNHAMYLLQERKRTLQRKWLHYRIIHHKIMEEKGYYQDSIDNEEAEIINELHDKNLIYEFTHPCYEFIAKWKKDLNRLEGKTMKLHLKIKELEREEKRIGCFF